MNGLRKLDGWRRVIEQDLQPLTSLQHRLVANVFAVEEQEIKRDEDEPAGAALDGFLEGPVIGLAFGVQHRHLTINHRRTRGHLGDFPYDGAILRRPVGTAVCEGLNLAILDGEDSFIS